MFWKTSGVEKSVLSPVTTEHSVEIYLNLHCTRAASINHVKANTKKLLQIPSDPGMTLFHIHPPSRTMWANPSLQYVSSFFLSCSSTFSFAHPAWPCNSAWTIQQCLLQPLFLRSSGFFLVSPPAVFVRNTVCQHLRKHLNKAWQGQSWRYGLPHSATFSFFPTVFSSPIRSFFHSMYIFYLPSLRATLALIISSTSANASAFIYFIFLSTPSRWQHYF